MRCWGGEHSAEKSGERDGVDSESGTSPVHGWPPALERVVRISPAKDPLDRWQSARDLCHALDLVRDASPSAPVTAAPFSRLWWAAGAVGLVAAAIAGGMALRRLLEPPSPVRFTSGESALRR